MNLSSQLLDYNALLTCTYVRITPQTSLTITCDIQPTGIATMAIKVLHNTCNMSFCDFPDMYSLNTLVYSPRALEYIRIRQMPHVHVTTIT